MYTYPCDYALATVSIAVMIACNIAHPHFHTLCQALEEGLCRPPGRSAHGLSGLRRGGRTGDRWRGRQWLLGSAPGDDFRF